MAAIETYAARLEPEVYAARGALVELDAAGVAFLVERARQSAKRKCRLLLHPHADDALHEMLIVHCRGEYIRPHRAAKSSKTYHVVTGAMALVLFEDDGRVRRTLAMGDPQRDGAFMVRIMGPWYHTIIPTTETVAFVETVPGPWRGTDYAPWAPPADGSAEARAYHAGLVKAAQS